MKSRNVIITAIILIAASLSTGVSAQEALKALVAKCENMENVNINVVRNRNKETRQMERTITSISFSNNPSLISEFLAAFEKDKEMADQEIENKANGRITNMFYRFGNTSYSFSQDDEGSGSVSIIEKADGETSMFYTPQ